jgi:hypothetical protein
VGVLSSTQTVGTNVGVRLPEVTEFQLEGKQDLSEKRKVARRMMQTVAVLSPPPQWGARANQLIGEVKGLITMP